jgi:DNA modification methylase
MTTDEEWIRDGHADKNSAGCHAVAIAALRERLERSRVVIGDCTLYNEDCKFILPHTGPVDAVVTDPPYGIGAAQDGKIGSGSKQAPSTKFDKSDWDNQPVAPGLMAEIMRRGNWRIIFGGNYYPMPPARCWLVWDKLNTGEFADCELAWTNLDKAVRRIQYRWSGYLRQNNEPRGDHPTQKPVGVMEWCIGHLPSEAMTILDPFMGSGTTGVACVRMGRKFVGIEREKKYFDAACRRIEDEYGRPRLDLDRSPEPRDVQTRLLE